MSNLNVPISKNMVSMFKLMIEEYNKDNFWLIRAQFMALALIKYVTSVLSSTIKLRGTESFPLCASRTFQYYLVVVIYDKFKASSLYEILIFSLLKNPISINPCLNISKMEGFSPVWIRLCEMRLSRRMNSCPPTSQMWDFSPVWSRWLGVKFD